MKSEVQVEKVHFSFYLPLGLIGVGIACGISPILAVNCTDNDRKVTCLRCRGTAIFRKWVHKTEKKLMTEIREFIKDNSEEMSYCHDLGTPFEVIRVDELENFLWEKEYTVDIVKKSK